MESPQFLCSLGDGVYHIADLLHRGDIFYNVSLTLSGERNTAIHKIYL